MKRSTQTFYRLAVLLGALTPGFGLAGCSHEQPKAQPDDLANLGVTSEQLGVEVPTCSQSGMANGFNSTTKVLALALPGTGSAAIMSVVAGNFMVNGYACVDSTGKKLVVADVKKIAVTGTTGNDKFIIDLLSGSFGATIFGAMGGFTVDLGAGTDAFSVRGSAAADKVTAGYPATGTDVYFELTGDKTADVKVSNTETFALSLSGGDDTFTGMGNSTITAAQLTSTVTALSALPATVAVTVYGGAGKDTLQGGLGNDTLNGGEDDDTFVTAAVPDGADVYVGGAGTDTVDYGLRSAALAITLDDAGNDGDSTINAAAMVPGENDNVNSDVENVTGGAGNDVITGSAVANSIKGGLGNDTLSPGLAGMSCTGITDTLDGGDGNDTFNMGTLKACPSVLIGGAGKDTADFQARTVALTITIDNTANDGEATETANVKTDVEVILGGTGADTITGSANADELHGGPGADTLTGLAGDDTLIGDGGADILNGSEGNDTFAESGFDLAYTGGMEPAGGGADVINGGIGAADVLDLSGRTLALTITLCVDATKPTGNTTLTTGGCGAASADGETGEGDEVINIESVKGGAGNDTITGSTADETLSGNAGDDTLSGGDGNDTIYGDAGNDTLNGGLGDDYLDDTVGTNTLDGGPGFGDVCIGGATSTLLNCEL